MPLLPPVPSFSTQPSTSRRDIRLAREVERQRRQMRAWTTEPLEAVAPQNQPAVMRTNTDYGRYLDARKLLTDSHTAPQQRSVALQEVQQYNKKGILERIGDVFTAISLPLDAITEGVNALIGPLVPQEKFQERSARSRKLLGDFFTGKISGADVAGALRDVHQERSMVEQIVTGLFFDLIPVTFAATKGIKVAKALSAAGKLSKGQVAAQTAKAVGKKYVQEAIPGSYPLKEATEVGSRLGAKAAVATFLDHVPGVSRHHPFMTAETAAQLHRSRTMKAWKETGRLPRIAGGAPDAVDGPWTHASDGEMAVALESDAVVRGTRVVVDEAGNATKVPIDEAVEDQMYRWLQEISSEKPSVRPSLYSRIDISETTEGVRQRGLGKKGAPQAPVRGIPQTQVGQADLGLDPTELKSIEDLTTPEELSRLAKEVIPAKDLRFVGSQLTNLEESTLWDLVMETAGRGAEMSRVTLADLKAALTGNFRFNPAGDPTKVRTHGFFLSDTLRSKMLELAEKLSKAGVADDEFIMAHLDATRKYLPDYVQDASGGRAWANLNKVQQSQELEGVWNKYLEGLGARLKRPLNANTVRASVATAHLLYGAYIGLPIHHTMSRMLGHAASGVQDRLLWDNYFRGVTDVVENYLVNAIEVGSTVKKGARFFIASLVANDDPDFIKYVNDFKESTAVGSDMRAAIKAQREAARAAGVKLRVRTTKGAVSRTSRAIQNEAKRMAKGGLYLDRMDPFADNTLARTLTQNLALSIQEGIELFVSNGVITRADAETLILVYKIQQLQSELDILREVRRVIQSSNRMAKEKGVAEALQKGWGLIDKDVRENITIVTEALEQGLVRLSEASVQLSSGTKSSSLTSVLKKIEDLDFVAADGKIIYNAESFKKALQDAYGHAEKALDSNIKPGGRFGGSLNVTPVQVRKAYGVSGGKIAGNKISEFDPVEFIDPKTTNDERAAMVRKWLDTSWTGPTGPATMREVLTDLSSFHFDETNAIVASQRTLYEHFQDFVTKPVKAQFLNLVPAGAKGGLNTKQRGQLADMIISALQEQALIVAPETKILDLASFNSRTSNVIEQTVGSAMTNLNKMEKGFRQGVQNSVGEVPGIDWWGIYSRADYVAQQTNLNVSTTVKGAAQNLIRPSERWSKQMAKLDEIASGPTTIKSLSAQFIRSILERSFGMSAFAGQGERRLIQGWRAARASNAEQLRITYQDVFTNGPIGKFWTEVQEAGKVHGSNPHGLFYNLKVKEGWQEVYAGEKPWLTGGLVRDKSGVQFSADDIIRHPVSVLDPTLIPDEWLPRVFDLTPQQLEAIVAMRQIPREVTKRGIAEMGLRNFAEWIYQGIEDSSTRARRIKEAIEDPNKLYQYMPRRAIYSAKDLNLPGVETQRFMSYEQFTRERQWENLDGIREAFRNDVIYHPRLAMENYARGVNQRILDVELYKELESFVRRTMDSLEGGQPKNITYWRTTGVRATHVMGAIDRLADATAPQHPGDIPFLKNFVKTYGEEGPLGSDVAMQTIAVRVKEVLKSLDKGEGASDTIRVAATAAKDDVATQVRFIQDSVYAQRQVAEKLGETIEYFKNGHKFYVPNASVRNNIRRMMRDPESQKKFLEKAAEINMAVRFVKTGADFSVGFIHGLPLAITHPVIWGKAIKKSIQSMTNPRIMAEYMAANLTDARELVAAGGTIGKFGNVTLEGGEAAIGLASRAGRGGRAAAGALQAFQTQFETFSTYTKIELWKGMKGMAKTGEERAKIATFVNNILGTINPATAGFSKNQRAFEALFLSFAPMYRRAVVASIFHMFSGGVTRTEALKMVLPLTVLPPMIFAFQSLLKDPEERDWDDPSIFNPASPNYLSIQIGDSRLGVGSAYVALTRAVFNVIEQAMDDEERGELGDFTLNGFSDNQLYKFIRSQVPLGAATAIDLFTGYTYNGESLRGDNGEILDFAGIAQVLTNPITPLGLDSMIESGLADGFSPNLIWASSDMFGMRSRPSSAYERRNQMRDYLLAESRHPTVVRLRDKFQSEGKILMWQHLPETVQFALEEDTPMLKELELETRERAMQGGSRPARRGAEYKTKLEENRTRRDAQINEVSQQFESGFISADQWRDRLDNIKFAYRNEREQLVLEYPDVAADWDKLKANRNPVEEKFWGDHLFDLYMENVVEASKRPNSPIHEIDREKYDRLLASFRAGVGSTAWDYIQERFEQGRADTHPEYQEFSKAKVKLSDYWNIQDKLFGRYSNEWYLWEQYSDIADPRLKAVFADRYPRIRRIAQEVEQAREAWRRKNPEGDWWLVKYYGRIPVTSDANRRYALYINSRSNMI